MHINIHKTEHNLDELLSFVHEMIETSYYPAYPREVMELFLRYHSRESLARDAEQGRVWAARQEGRLVGTVTVSDGELTRMFVSPAARGRGLGAELAGEALRYARESGVKKLTAWAVPFSRGFYEKLGFQMLNADVVNFENTRSPAVPYIEMALWPLRDDSVAIGRAGEAEIEEILAGQREAFREQCELYDDWGIPPVTEQADDVRGYLLGGGLILAARQGGRIIGAVRGMLEGEICNVARLWVLQDWQGRSVGRRLVAALEEAFPACRAFSIFTGERSERNLGLYTRQGYAPTGKRAPARPGSLTGNYDLVWLLKPNPWPSILSCARRFSSS